MHNAVEHGVLPVPSHECHSRRVSVVAEAGGSSRAGGALGLAFEDGDGGWYVRFGHARPPGHNNVRKGREGPRPYSAARTGTGLAASVDFHALTTGSTSLANSLRPRSATA